MLAGAVLGGGIITHLAFGAGSLAPVILTVSAGVMLYVAATDLIPEINGERHYSIPLAVAAGIVVFILTRALLP